MADNLDSLLAVHSNEDNAVDIMQNPKEFRDIDKASLPLTVDELPLSDVDRDEARRSYILELVTRQPYTDNLVDTLEAVRQWLTGAPVTSEPVPTADTLPGL